MSLYFYALGIFPCVDATRSVLCHVDKRLKTLPRGTQSALAIELGIEPKELSLVLRRQKNAYPELIVKLEEWLNRTDSGK